MLFSGDCITIKSAEEKDIVDDFFDGSSSSSSGCSLSDFPDVPLEDHMTLPAAPSTSPSPSTTVAGTSTTARSTERRTGRSAIGPKKVDTKVVSAKHLDPTTSTMFPTGDSSSSSSDDDDDDDDDVEEEEEEDGDADEEVVAVRDNNDEGTRMTERHREDTPLGLNISGASPVGSPLPSLEELKAEAKRLATSSTETAPTCPVVAGGGCGDGTTEGATATAAALATDAVDTSAASMEDRRQRRDQMRTMSADQREEHFRQLQSSEEHSTVLQAADRLLQQSATDAATTADHLSPAGFCASAPYSGPCEWLEKDSDRREEFESALASVLSQYK